MSFNCPKCICKYDNITSLAKHWLRTHKQTTESLYLCLNNISSAPTCACGCGGKVKFLDAGRGYSTYTRGHQSRVNNNFQTEKSKKNSLKTRRKMLEEGTWKPFASNETGNVWNAGLTKEDPRIAAAISKRETEEYKKISSERMREGRTSGKIPTLRGDKHSQWNGGISSLNHTCRSSTKLYREWIYPKLKENNFKCSVCSSNGRLEVHHDKESFSQIYTKIAHQFNFPLKITVSLSPDTDPEIQMLKIKISDAVAQYHIDNNISGKVLCDNCHELEHEK